MKSEESEVFDLLWLKEGSSLNSFKMLMFVNDVLPEKFKSWQIRN